MEAVYFSTLRTEESQPIRVEIVYLNPDDPDPDEPPVVRSHRWRFYRFDVPYPFDVGNLVKLAPATDGRTSSLAVFKLPRTGLRLVGVVDEGIGHGRLRNRELSFMTPGLFRIVTLGIGRIAAYIDLQRVGELNGNELRGKDHDVLSAGPIADTIAFGSTVALINSEAWDPTQVDQFHLSHWTESVAKLLLRIQGHHHGGAILIARGRPREDDLHIKYPLAYPRLRDSLVTLFESLQAQRAVDRESRDSRLASRALRSQEARARHRVEDAKKELEGTIWFLSLLSRVDGCLSLDMDLELFGFGAEILHNERPPTVTVAEDHAGDVGRPIAYEKWGTRHRSMMRAVFAQPGAIGFVVSQDGDVRAMARVGDGVTVWDGVQLQFDRPAADEETRARQRERRARWKAVMQREHPTRTDP